MLSVLTGLFCFFVAGSVGCRTATDNQIDLLERELRTQEDYIYELEDYVLEYSEELRATRSMQSYVVEPQTSTNEPILAPKKPAKKPVVKPPAAPLPEADRQPEELEQVEPEDIEIPELEFDEPEPLGQIDEYELKLAFDEELDTFNGQVFDEVEETEIEGTEIEGTEEFVEETVEEYASEEIDYSSEVVYVDEEVGEEGIDLVDSTDEPSERSPLSEAEFLEKLFEEEIPEESPVLEYRQVKRLVIVGIYRADDADTRPTSLMTVIEARDESNEPIDLDGRVSLMIMTTDAETPQRLKRWDFSVEETASAWQSSPLGDGLHLELPLDELVVSEEPSELWVRLVGADGRKFLDQLPLEWEQLASVVSAMETQTLPTDEQRRIVESNALPLVDEPASPPAQVSQIASKTSPQWRTSMQRTHPANNGYVTTSPVSRGWTSQPIGGREPPAARAGVKRFSSTVRQAAAAPEASSSRKTDRPRWSPPRSDAKRR